MAKRKSINDVKEKLIKVHGSLVSLVESSYIRVGEKADFLDKDYGFWNAYVSNVLKGSKHPIRAVKLQKQNNIIKFGSTSPFGSKTVQDKIKNTFLIKYGVDHNWKASDVKQKQKQTMLKQYGVDHNMKVAELALKNARSRNDSTIINHWKTNQELVCVASYEKAFVEWCNKNKINFDWQIVKKLSNGKTFRVDAYLIDEDKFIEIKGYFKDQDAKDKWEMFHREYSNSELWTEKELKKLKIL